MDEFTQKVEHGEFVVHGDFGGNSYGFTHETLHPRDKHLLVNAWPWLVPQFSALPHIVIVGMQAPDDWKPLLTERMQKRGDDEATIQKRLGLITKDIADLRSHKDIVEAHGKYFIIKNDTTIGAHIIPWIVGLLETESSVA